MPEYMPVLSIRPAEVVALAELPDLSKDRMIPLILIKPWLGSGALVRGLDKIKHGFPARPWFAELDPEYEPAATSDSFAEIQKLRDPSDGFRNWIAFVQELASAIPVLRLRGVTDTQEILKQIDNASELGRGVCIRVERTILLLKPLVDVLAQRPDIDITMVLDYGQQDARLLVNVIPAKADVAYIREKIPGAKISLSATTFPSAFGSNSSQEIYERSFFNLVNSDVGGLIFSDRGSARAGEQGGGGVPRPRIDLPSQSRWNFYRSDCVRGEGETNDSFRRRRLEAYGQMADEAVKSADWDKNLNIWGTQLIKITQLRSPFGITSPAKATACRINIHLARQSLYGLGVSSEELEEEWVD
jgi:hypothetical protein